MFHLPERLKNSQRELCDGFETPACASYLDQTLVQDVYQSLPKSRVNVAQASSRVLRRLSTGWTYIIFSIYWGQYSPRTCTVVTTLTLLPPFRVRCCVIYRGKRAPPMEGSAFGSNLGGPTKTTVVEGLVIPARLNTVQATNFVLTQQVRGTIA